MTKPHPLNEEDSKAERQLKAELSSNLQTTRELESKTLDQLTGHPVLISFILRGLLFVAFGALLNLFFNVVTFTVCVDACWPMTAA